MGTWPERLRYQPMKGDLPEGLLGQDAELEGELGEEDGGVVVAEVVGGVDGDLVEYGGGRAWTRVTGEREIQRRTLAQSAGDGVLLTAGFIPKVPQTSEIRPKKVVARAITEHQEEVGKPAKTFGAGR